MPGQKHSGFELAPGENITMPGTEKVDGVDISVHAADLAAHHRNIWELMVTGDYYPSLLIADEIPNPTAIVADTLYAVPYPLPVEQTFSHICIQITTGVAGNVRLGIYNDNGSIAPGALRLDAGTIDCTVAGVKEIASAMTLPKGIYWLAMVSDVAPSTYLSSKNLALMGSDTTVGVHNGQHNVAFVYAVLPDPFPGGAARTYSIWAIALKKS